MTAASAIIESRGSDVTTKRLSGAFTCDECGALSVASAYRPTIEIHIVGTIKNEQWIDINAEALTWLPPPGLYVEFPGVPEHIASAETEVHWCLTFGAPRAAVALARAVVEAVAKDQGINTGNLKAKIDELASKGLVRPATAAAAHEVRLDGNEVAHGDVVVQAISLPEARDTVAIVDELLDEIFQSPARLARVQTNRAARQPPATPPP